MWFSGRRAREEVGPFPLYPLRLPFRPLLPFAPATRRLRTLSKAVKSFCAVLPTLRHEWVVMPLRKGVHGEREQHQTHTSARPPAPGALPMATPIPKLLLLLLSVLPIASSQETLATGAKVLLHLVRCDLLEDGLGAISSKHCFSTRAPVAVIAKNRLRRHIMSSICPTTSPQEPLGHHCVDHVYSTQQNNHPARPVYGCPRKSVSQTRMECE
mmetsp:Transcript_17357/g.37320  ORF Transcript_17357/g.37320 Transcript_17357/m.37320 type:complete len:213 (-) Transcript_17357:25-663(-)